MARYIPPGTAEDIMDFIRDYGMNVLRYTFDDGELSIIVESPTPIKWDAVVEMIEFEFDVKALIGRFDYQDEYTATLAIYF